MDKGGEFADYAGIARRHSIDIFLPDYTPVGSVVRTRTPMACYEESDRRKFD